jgi:hypothetical protein
VTGIRKTAFFNALVTTVYIALVGAFMFYGGEIRLGRTNTLLVPIALLLLFVFSAALTGFLIFGRPVLWYLDGKKKEALELLFTTLGFFSGITAVVILLLVSFTRG